MESDVYSSLSSACHHEMFMQSWTRRSNTLLPMSVISDSSRAEKASINRAIYAIDLEELFANKTVESQVYGLNNQLLNTY